MEQRTLNAHAMCVKTPRAKPAASGQRQRKLVTVGRSFGRAAVVALALDRADGAAFFVISRDVGADRARANRRVGLRPLSGTRFGADRRDHAGVRYSAAAFAGIRASVRRHGECWRQARPSGGEARTAHVAVDVIARDRSCRRRNRQRPALWHRRTSTARQQARPTASAVVLDNPSTRDSLARRLALKPTVRAAADLLRGLARAPRKASRRGAFPTAFER